MTNDQRNELEDAILAYGTACRIHASIEADSNRGELAHKAVRRAWERIHEAINALEADDG